MNTNIHVDLVHTVVMFVRVAKGSSAFIRTLHKQTYSKHQYLLQSRGVVHLGCVS